MQFTSVRLSRLAWSTLFLATLIFADQSTVNNPLQIEQIDSRQSVLHFQMPAFNMGQVTLASGVYEQIQSPLQSTVRDPGAPEIPTSVTYLAIPEDGQATVSVEILASSVMQGIELVPTQAEQLEVETFGSGFLKNDAIYTQNDWYPQSPAALYATAKMRDLTIAPLEVRPFQYNPVTKELRVITEMRVSVNYDRELTAPEHPVSPLFAPLYQAVIANYPEVATEEMARPTYLFIVPNNFAVTGILAPLIAWKHEKGFNVYTATTSETGTTSSAIKSYIQNAYNNWPDRPDLICLVGDASGSFNIPAWTESWSGYSGEGDHPYTHLAGGDYIADAFIGRLSFTSTTQLLTIVNKILFYEKTPYTTSTDWFTHAVLAGDPASSGQSTITTNQYINEVTENYGFSNTTIFSGSFPTQISAGINQGASYFNYRGWLGMSGWTDSNTSALTNGFMMPFVTILTCGTGSFASGQARSEAFLTVGSPSTPKGGIAAIGTATSGTHTLYNNCVDGGIYQGLFNEQLYYAGSSLARGWFNLNLSFPNDNHNYVEIFSHWNNLMGDPGVELWTGVPSLLTVSAPDTLPASADYITVNVTNGIGFPISNAWVTILQGADVVFETGNTDASGDCVLPLAGLENGSLRLTVSRHNSIPVQQDIVVTNMSQEMAVNSYTVTETSGNNDGILNPGESASVSFNLKNLGTQQVSGLVGVISANDGISFSDTLDLGNVAASDSVNFTGVSFDLPTHFPGNGVVDITVSLVADSNSWSDHVVLDVFAPNFELTDLTEQGQSNPSFDPGEATTLVLNGLNIGRNGSSNLVGTLVSLTEEITVTNGTATFGDGFPNDALSNNGTPFNINLSTQLTVGTQVPLELQLTDDSGFEQTVSILLPIGTPTVTDPLGPDAGGYFCYDDGDLAYALAPTFSWNSISPTNFGSGISVGLNDHGSNQDDIVTLSMPFVFGYYGQNYAQISIGSNGYVSFGTSDQGTFRNWPIPGALGPSPMIAGFWDDLKLGTGSGVYTKFDQVEHKYIIEYENMVNMFDGTSRETFQIILYDPQYYGSVDGNGDILILYNEVHNIDTGTSSSSSYGNYATVGTENQTGTIGLSYTFNNTYPVAAKPLQNQMALFFTTRTDDILPCPGWGRGDVNHDGLRNVQDLITTVNVIFGYNPGECGLWAADMNSDSLVNVSDVVMQVNLIMGTNLLAKKGIPAQSANFQIENGRLMLNRASGVAGFQINLITDEKPILIPQSGLVLRLGETPLGYRILGYWNTPPPEEYNIALIGNGEVVLDQPIVADQAGQSFMAKTTLVPATFEISNVFPNPFNPSVNLEYNLPTASDVSVTIYNQLGQRVAGLVNQEQSAGKYTIRWNSTDDAGRQVSSGVYLAQIRAGELTRVAKLTLMR